MPLWPLSLYSGEVFRMSFQDARRRGRARHLTQHTPVAALYRVLTYRKRARDRHLPVSDI